MERALSVAEFAILAEYAAIGDRLGYYATLGEWGFEYGTLAQQVVNNEGLSGTAANGFFLRVAAEEGVDLNGDPTALASISIYLMQLDLAARFDTGGVLTSQDYQQYHQDAFSLYNVSIYAWTAATPLIIAEQEHGLETREALWQEMLQDGVWNTIQAGAWAGRLVNEVRNDPSHVLYEQADAWNLNIFSAPNAPYDYVFGASNQYGGYVVAQGDGFIRGGTQESELIQGGVTTWTAPCFDRTVGIADKA